MAVFDKRTRPRLAPGEDPVDSAPRVPYPVNERFVLCDAAAVELGRFALLEEAMDAMRALSGRMVVYALKSGRPMCFSAPTPGSAASASRAAHRE